MIGKRRLTLALGAVGTAHLALGVAVWFFVGVAAAKVDGMRSLGAVAGDASPCVVLLAIFAAGWVGSLRRKRWAGPLLAVGLALSAAMFGYDYTQRRWTLHIHGMTGGESYRLFATWWWCKRD